MSSIGVSFTNLNSVADGQLSTGSSGGRIGYLHWRHLATANGHTFRPFAVWSCWGCWLETWIACRTPYFYPLHCFPWPNNNSLSDSCTCGLEGFTSWWNNSFVDFKLSDYSRYTTFFLKFADHSTTCNSSRWFSHIAVTNSLEENVLINPFRVLLFFIVVHDYNKKREEAIKNLVFLIAA